MSATPYMAIETTRELFDRIVSYGVSPDRLRENTGIDIELLQQSEKRFPVEQHLKLWQVAESLLPHKAIGLLMGAESNPSNRGIVGLTFLASRNLKDAVSNKLRYTKILADHIDLEYLETEEAFVIRYSIPDPYFHPNEIERVFSGFFNWVKIFTKQNIFPSGLAFQYAKPACIKAYHQYFQCPMEFGHTENHIAFSKDLFACKNLAYNDYLYGILQARAESVLTRLDQDPDFLVNVRSTIAGRLCHGNFSADEVAEAFNVSLRTLHRKLKEYDVTYQQILDEVRKDMAIAYLNQQDCCHKTLPYLVGYADSRAFQRAFKRWTGYSPRQYHQLH